MKPGSHKCEAEHHELLRAWQAERFGVPDRHSSPEDLTALYEPLCGERVQRLAHLGQSADGFIAGADGCSRGLSSLENLLHLHRLRALFDVVLVGGATARTDDPQLTTRLVSGPNATRAVLDPLLKCPPHLQLFNGEAPTVVLCCQDAPSPRLPASVKLLRLRTPFSQLNAAATFEALKAEGLPRVFVEGGGALVSRAYREGCLDRLHIALAPLFIGSGVPGLAVGSVDTFQSAHRPRSRQFQLGSDVLFDFDLKSQPAT